jgi:uncharacterized protein (UPF0335 family)
LDFAEHNSKAVAGAAEDLREFVTRFEALEAEKADVAREMSDQMTVMKSRGYDVAALRRVLKERKRDRAELEAEKDTAQLYMELLR